jgi:hypothetical protein
MILAKRSFFWLLNSCHLIDISPLSHFVFGTFNLNQVTSVTTRDVFGAMIFCFGGKF